MAFGGGGFGSGGFGSNNTNTFGGGGFGANTNTGFGTSNTTSAFGANTNTGNSLFGGNNNTSSPFGGGNTFGNNTNTTTTFGSKAFGSTTGLFGGGTSSSSTFGGFGATSNQPSTGFGTGNTSGGGLFGQNKTGFGTSTTTTGGSTLFGGGSNTGGFGSNTTSGGFGASTTGGFGAAATGQQPNNGTASTPFAAFEEKDGAGRQQFQTITFQQPYQQYSLEELRLVDYNQGRRFGNQNGQGGAFGQNTGFGGFAGNTNNTSTGFGANTSTNTGGGGLFGNTGAASTPFGGSGTTAFGGSNTNTAGGGLFGQNKPATGLFGATATSQPASGGLFGNTAATNTGGGFGSSFGAGNTGGGGSGLFGQNNQAQSKPFGFGNTTTTTPAANPFGGGTNTNTFGQSTNTGGLFGAQNQTSAAPAFGSTPQTTTTGGLFGGASFGQTQQNQPQNQQSGGLFGGFGQNQQNQAKPSLFGAGPSTGTTAGGLFGQNNQNQQQSGGLFGNTNTNQNQGSSLFGQKPATTGGGLFGGAASNTGTGSGGGLFGSLNTQNNQQNSGGLFGQQSQQKPSGLFGGSTTNTNTGGGGLFGSTGQNNTNTGGLGGSLFGSQNQQQPQQSTMGGSLFGASGNSLLQTSMNTNPYGNDALFAGISTPTQSPGPLATPLSGGQKQRKNAILPQHKLNPSASARLVTPQRRAGGGGFGFSYSTYGTPGSASSTGSPSYSSSFMGSGSLQRSLAKSLSTSNLRNSYTPETSILAPGAFSTNGRSFNGGSLKKLNINRSINTRVPLFDDPAPEPRKRVSFANDAPQSNGVTNGNGINGSSSGPLILREEPESIPSGHGSASQASSTPTLNGDASHAAPSRPEMQQVNGKELTPVPENGALAQRTSSSLNAQTGSDSHDPTPGNYYTEPALDDLKKMSRQQLQKVSNFVVGRHLIGRIEFNEGRPVDLTDVELDKLCGDIVQLTARNATVYGETCTATKPARGTGLNQPSRIILGNSWPRGYAGGKRDPGKLRVQKHGERLKRVAGTDFEQYVKETGEWIFRVPHFSSYGLNYDDFSDDEDEEMESSELSPVPDTPAPAQLRSSQMTGTPDEDSFVSPTQSSPDDTFDFKKGKRKRASVPGGYGDEVAYEEEEDEADEEMHGNSKSFLGERSVGSHDGPDDEDYSEDGEFESDEDQDMAGSVSGPVQTTEQVPAKESDPFKDSIMPKSILKPTQKQRSVFGTPSKGQLIFEDDWANQLQRTISPKKQDRQALRESQGTVLREREDNMGNLAKSLNGPTIATSIDLMNSLFGETNNRDKAPVKRTGRGIEMPYPKRPKTAHDLDELSQFDKEFFSCNKPHFSETGQLTYATIGVASLEGGLYPTSLEPISGQHKDVRFTKLPTFPDAASPTLDVQKQHSKIREVDGVPFAQIHSNESYLDFEDLVKACPVDTDAGKREGKVWELLSLLFDESDDIPSDMNHQQLEDNRDRFRKDKLIDWWTALVHEDAQEHSKNAKTSETQAIALLSGHNVADACLALVNGLDLRLTTMVAQIGGDVVMRQDMATQIEEWRRQDTLSEMDDSIRALYELLAGNCAQAEGKIGADGRENKVHTFSIAGRFGLDWRRAFGLRLWYGTLADEPIELAVAQYADALREGREDVKPVPWFVEQGVDMGWRDPDPEIREDIFWGILKLYASSKLELPANIEDVLAPQNVSGHPLNARLSFQLFQIFKSRLDDDEENPTRKIGMPTVREGGDLRSSFLVSTTSTTDKDEQASNPLVELGDNLALTYAASLHTPEHWTTGIFVYEHLSSPAMREHYIRTLLAQYSHTYSLVESDDTYKYLRFELRIPDTWLHAAAALQSKTEGDNVHQVIHLIKAGELDEAHEVLCRNVGPESIISRDYDALRELLGEFIPTPVNSPADDSASVASSIRSRSHHKNEPVHGWNLGGQVYFDYINLLDLTSHQSSYRVDEDLNKEIRDLLTKLQQALEIVSKDRLMTCGLEERVALTEISSVVANLVAKNKHADRARILKLPLTEDGWLRHSQDLSLGYYRAVMAGGS